LKSQITNLSNIIDKDKLDSITLKLRIVRLTQLYHTFKEHNDELAILDSSDTYLNEFTNIQERFYSLAGRIENIINGTNDTSNHETRSYNSEPVAIIKKRRVKLPDATLPTFDGGFEGWLSFKNSTI